jgi:nucleoside-diphosphate-sugar epimerase
MGMKKRILICGSTGFIGRNLTQFFSEQYAYDVYAAFFRRSPVGYPNVKSIQVDLRDPQQVERAIRGMDIIIQAAATTSGANDIVNRPYIHVTDNAVMNSLIFRAAHEQGVSHVIFFSCSVMYPSSEQALKESDFDANLPMHAPYFGVGWTKVYIEKMGEFYAKLGRTRYTVIRHSNVYGPHDKFDLERSHVLGASITKVMTNKNGEFTVWGPGTEVRDLLYIDDLVDFVAKAIQCRQAGFQLVNVGSAKGVTINELIQKVIAYSGKQLTVSHDLSKPHLPVNIRLDISKAEKNFGWRPTTDLEDGIRKTMAWYQENISW